MELNHRDIFTDKEVMGIWKSCWNAMGYKQPEAVELFVETQINLSQADAVPGQYRIYRTEPVREIYKCLEDSGIKTIVIMSATQFFKTQFILNTLLYYIKEKPSNIVLGLPTNELVQQFMKGRFEPMCRENSIFFDLISDNTKNELGVRQSILQRRFYGGMMTAWSSQNTTGFISVPAKLVVLDEIDKFQRIDSIAEAEDRRKNFPDGKMVLASSPEDADTSMINMYYEKSDRRIYEALCPICERRQELLWSRVRWDENRSGTVKSGTARYLCEGCNKKWDDDTRIEAVLSGGWRKRNPEIKDVAGFNISSLYSQLIKLEDLVSKFISARRDADRGLVETMRRFKKNQLGLPATDMIESVDWRNVMNILGTGTYTSDKIPNEVILLTCAVDVQKDRFELEVKGWGVDNFCIGIHFRRLVLDLTDRESWKMLHNHIQSFTAKREDGVELGIFIMFIDSGGLYTDDVYRFCRWRGRRGIQNPKNRYHYFPIKGASKFDARVIERAMWNDELGNELIHIGTIDAKAIIYTWLASSIRKEKKILYSSKVGYDKAYYIGLCAEKEVRRFERGKKVHKFELKRPELHNEGIDLFVYNYAALCFAAGNQEEIDNYLIRKEEKNKLNK